MARIAIIGAGGMARQHAECFSRIPGAEVVGFADADAARVDALVQRFGGVAYRSTDDMLASAGAEVADICSITPLHLNDALVCAQNAIPTIIEKPLARHLADGRRIVQAFQQAGVPLLPAHVVRWFPDFVAARREAQAGMVGQPAVVRVSRGGPFPLGRNNWYADPAQSGGVLLDMMIHDFDWLRWTFGEVQRVSASSLMANGSTNRDYGLALLRFQSGVIAHVEGTWVHTDGFRVDLEISGDGGVMELSTAFPNAFKLRQNNAAEAAVAVPESPLVQDPYTVQLQELLAAAVQGAPARVNADDALKALEISEACWRSAATGESVSLPLP